MDTASPPNPSPFKSRSPVIRPAKSCAAALPNASFGAEGLTAAIAEGTAAAAAAIAAAGVAAAGAAATGVSAASGLIDGVNDGEINGVNNGKTDGEPNTAPGPAGTTLNWGTSETEEERPVMVCADNDAAPGPQDARTRLDVSTTETNRFIYCRKIMSGCALSGFFGSKRFRIFGSGAGLSSSSFFGAEYSFFSASAPGIRFL